jgi:hypothetical protein
MSLFAPITKCPTSIQRLCRHCDRDKWNFVLRGPFTAVWLARCPSNSRLVLVNADRPDVSFAEQLPFRVFKQKRPKCDARSTHRHIATRERFRHPSITATGNASSAGMRMPSFSASGEVPGNRERASRSALSCLICGGSSRRGQPLTIAGLDDLLDGARRRAGLAHATCHELRHPA